MVPNFRGRSRSFSGWYTKFPATKSTWLNQPSWIMCSSNKNISPISRVNRTNCLKPPPTSWFRVVSWNLRRVGFENPMYILTSSTSLAHQTVAENHQIILSHPESKGTGAAPAPVITSKCWRSERTKCKSPAADGLGGPVTVASTVRVYVDSLLKMYRNNPGGHCYCFFFGGGGAPNILTPMFGLTLGSQWGKSSLFK